MMQAALLTSLCAKSPDDEIRLGNNLAEIEAGTGTGKSVAYCLAAIVASELLEKTVIVSTATVALQERLFHKDLPRLAEIVPELRFDIIKGAIASAEIKQPCRKHTDIGYRDDPVAGDRR
jgi:ATP-dependent DNA helicase DinG